LNTLIRSLSKREVSVIGALLDCPYFNKRPEVARLFRHLAANVHQYEGPQLLAAGQFAAAFPGELYHNQRLRHTQSYLLHVIRQYLLLEELEKHEPVSRYWLLRALRRRGQDVMLEKERRRAETLLSESPLRDATWHLYRYQLIEEDLSSRSLHERSAKLDMQPMHEQLTAHYLSEMLRHACLAHTHTAIAAKNYNTNLIQQVLHMAGSNEGFLNYPSVAIYYYGYRALSEPQQGAHFDLWKVTLDAHGHQFGPTELRGIYLMGINYCIRKMNSGQRDYIAAGFDLYKAGLERDLLTEDGWLSGFTFKNIIRIGMALGETDWTIQFFESQRVKLHPKERQAHYLYNKAYLHFIQNDFDRAMPLLQQVDFPDVLNNLDARRMLLRSYYELQEWSALDSHLASFETYLRRHKDMGYHRDLNLNLVRFSRKLVEIPTFQRDQLILLANQVESISQVAEKTWLLDKIREKAENGNG
jgi:hypothetical protein